MHPIERLRYVARASHVPGAALARETAMALADFVGDDAAMLIACRRILDRQPTSGALVWLAAHALGAPDQRKALWDAVEALEDDGTNAALAYSLPDDAVVAAVGWTDTLTSLARRRGDLGFVVVDADGSAEYQIDRVVDETQRVTLVDAEAVGAAFAEATVAIVEFEALGPEGGLAVMGSFPAAAVASRLGLEVWGVAAVGASLGERMYAGLIGRWNQGTQDPHHLRAVEEVPAAVLDKVVTAAGLGSVTDAVARSGCPIVPELY